MCAGNACLRQAIALNFACFSPEAGSYEAGKKVQRVNTPSPAFMRGMPRHGHRKEGGDRRGRKRAVAGIKVQNLINILRGGERLD